MIQSRELRVGNILEYSNQNVTVLEIQRYNKVELGYFTDSIGFNRNLNDVNIKFIPLTEEWLGKLGFTKKIKQGIRYELEGDICVDLAFSVTGWSLEVDGLQCFRAIKSVHQLQNLYFALTGEELTIKND